MKTLDLSKFAREIHAQNKAVGWWDGEPCIYEKMQLISTEIAEATEGERKDLMDNKLPHRKMGEVELADALIRTLDLGERLGLKINTGRIDDCIKLIKNDPELYKTYCEYTVGHKHLGLNRCVVIWSLQIESEKEYSELIAGIFLVADSLGYDIMTAAREKHEFNKTRADHKRENRAAAHGKKF